MRALTCAAALAALTACGGPSSTAAPSTTPSPSASLTSAPRPSAATLLLAVQEKTGLGVYKVGIDRRAVRVELLRPPAGTTRSYAATLSQGARPDACVVWGTEEEATRLRCYGFGDTTGRPVAVHGRPGQQVALRPDATALVYTAFPTPGHDDEEVVTAAYARGVVSRSRVNPSDGAACGPFVVGTMWAGDRLLLECGGENDNPGGLLVRPRGAGASADVPDDQDPYTFFTEPGGADASAALVVQGEYCEISCDDKQPPEARRAVRVDLATGRVLEVIATPSAGRNVTSVSGGADGIAYTTGGAGDPRVYVRLPGEKHGVLVTGLPAGAGQVVAQP